MIFPFLGGWTLFYLAISFGIYGWCAELIPLEASVVVKTSSGSYFKEHPHLIPYETTTHLFFRANFPKFSVEDPGACDSTDILCQTKKSSFNVAMDLRNFVEDTGNGRPKRQILLMAAGAAGALLLESIFSRFSKKLFGSEDEAVDHLYQFQKSMEAKDFGMYANLTHLVMEHVEKSVERWWFLEQKIETVQRELLYLVQIEAMSSKIQMGIERCANNLIPTQFVPVRVLKTMLGELSQKVNKKGFMLSIPNGNINEYLKLNIADCFITPTGSYVMINIPITKETWKIVESVPISFRLENKTCHVSRPQNDILAISKKGRMEIIDSSMSGLCDIVSDHLCLVPKFSKKNDICAIHMYNASYNESERSCNVECFNSLPLLFNNVDSNVVVITNADSVNVNCPNAKRSFTGIKKGAIEIFVECNCTYEINGEYRDLGQTCIESANNNNISVIVPYFHLDGIGHMFNLTDSVIDNGTSLIKRLNDILQNNESPTADKFLENWHYRDIWILSLTVGVILLGVFAATCCWCFCK